MEHDTSLVIIAVGQVLTAMLTFAGIYIASQTREIAQKTELNTNSMREALVIEKGKASFHEGKEEGRAEGEAKAAVLAKGQLAAGQTK